jgi:hypothetical protein
MRTRARIPLLGGLLTGALVACTAMSAPAAQAGFGLSRWEAGTCVNTTCTYAEVEKEVKEKKRSELAYTQAAGHPPWGGTTFELKHKNGIGVELEGAPLKRVRVDVAPGLGSNPQAPVNPVTHEKCSIEQFEAKGGPKCPEGTEVGTDEAIAVVAGVEVPAEGKVYNLEPQPGEPLAGLKFEPIPLLFGIVITVKGVSTPELSFLEGHVSWAKEPKLEERCIREPSACPAGGIPSGDYHEWFELNGLSEKTPVMRSKLNFNGRAGGNFITLPSECSSTTLNYIEIESWKEEKASAKTETPVGVEGCDKVPFKPTVEVHPETAQSDQPDGATTEVKVPQKPKETEINSSDPRDAHVTLPEGLTLNSAAARGLQVCTREQIGIGTTNPVACPPASKIGEVTIEVDLPEKSLTGNVYLGAPAGEPITGPPFTIYVDAESAKYGVSVRLPGQVQPNLATGRLEASFLSNPQQPFSDFIFKSKGGAQAPLANPLACSTEFAEATFSAYSGPTFSLAPTPFTTTGCPSPLPFSWVQSTSGAPSNAGAFGETSYTFNLARSDGQQYLSKIATALPLGLVSAIPAVTLCGEPQAAHGTCSAASQIGTASVSVGAGPEPYALSAPVFLTGPYGGGPFGLSIPVSAVEGPFNFGSIVTRAAITVDPHTGRVFTTTSPLTQIVQGVPVRLKSVSVTVNRPNFLYNPTNCGALATATTLTSTLGTTQSLSSPFAVSSCAALAFTPSFSVSTSANASKANGASLQVNVTQPAHQANIRSVVTRLPIQLPARLTTLQQACPDATYAANPLTCPTGSNVGTATAATPVLPGTLSGPAYLVSHGNAAFPDLDLVLEGSGVRVILEGNSDIKGGVTTTTFASLPDAPLSRFALTLPMGPHSALAAPSSLCAQPLYMPTTITAQNGAQIKQNTPISVAGCAGGGGEEGEEGIIDGHRLFKILKRTVVGHTLLLKIRTFVPGRITAKGRYLKTATRRLRKPTTTTLKLRLTRGGLSALQRLHPLKIRVSVTLAPSKRGERSASARTSVAFKN